MPEPCELRPGGGQRRGMAVPEADDGDPGQEIEVSAAVRVVKGRALAADEGQVLAGVDGENRGRRQGAHWAASAQ